MGSEWKTVRLGDHVDASLGKMLDKNKNRGTLHPYLGNKQVRWGSFDLDDLSEMKFEDHEHERYGLSYGDLVVCEGGEPGRCTLWRDEVPNMKIQKALHRIRPNPDLNSVFLHYWFCYAGKFELLEPYFTGTTIQHLTGKAIAELPIPLPPLPEQNAITAQGTTVKIKTVGSDDFICLTDIAKSKNSEHPDDLIRNWLRNRNTLELLGIWERLHNPAFNPVEFDGIKERAGLNSFTLTPKQWIEQVQAIGIQSKAGRYGGTYAHRDIAFEFASWVSVEFKLYLIKDFQRLKEDENNRLSLSWDLNRTLSKINYRIHTDAIKANLIPAEVSKEQAAVTYASEGDLLNVALFGCTAKEWRAANPDLKGNIRDQASIEQLLVLANIESMNAEFIHMKLSASERLMKLNSIAIRQMKSLTTNAELTKQLPNHGTSK